MITTLLQDLYPWIDALWLPILFFAVHKNQRIWAVGLVLGCMLMLRMQAELMGSIGFETGILPFLDATAMTRGMITYSCFYAFYFIIARTSPGSHKHVMMAATISIFFAAMFVSSLVMLL